MYYHLLKIKYTICALLPTNFGGKPANKFTPAYNTQYFPTLFRIYCFIAFFFLKIANSNCQTPEFKNYTTADGLITDEVYNLYQDRQGYIWVFSKYGTLKYNGSEFKQVLQNLPFNESFIYSIYENRSGKKWVANSNARIYEIVDDSAYIISGLEAVSSELRNTVSEIAQLYVDDSLNIYALTKGHSYKFIKTARKYYPQNLSFQKFSDSVRLRIYQKDSTLLPVYNRSKNDEFLSTNVKEKTLLELVNEKQVIKLKYEAYTVPSRHFKIFGRCKYFTASNFLGKINSDFTISYFDFGSVVLNFTIDKNQHIWVGCLNGGLFELDENDSILNHYLQNHTVNDVLVDFQNGIWISTSTMGLFHFENRNLFRFSGNGALGLPISFIKQLGDELFVANVIGDLFVINQGDCIQLRKADNNTPLGIMKMDNNLMVTLPFFTETFDGNRRTNKKIVDTKTAKVHEIHKKSSDTLIYIWRRGIVFSVKGVRQKMIDFGKKITCSMLIKNKLWFGTEEGVGMYNPLFQVPSSKVGAELIPDKDSLLIPNYLKILRYTKIFKIIAESDSSIWFCTEGDGLYNLHNGKLLHYTVKQGLPSNIVNNICFARDDLILLSTNVGLFSSRSMFRKIENIKWNQLYSGEVRQAVHFENKIYFSSKAGLLVIPDSKRKNLFTEPSFILKSILVDSRVVQIKDFTAIQSEQTNLEFLFDLITFQKSKPNIAYTLVGETFESGIVRGRGIKFNRLVPGSYSLTCFPYTMNGIKRKITIPFKVIPAFYQTPLFRVLSIVVFVALLSFGVLFILKSNRKKQTEKAKNEQLIIEYKLVALKAQINPHFMSNCLSAIQHLIVDNKTDRASFYIAKFGLMVRKILDFSTLQEIALQEELELLRIYIELEQLRFENKFDFELFIDDSISLPSTLVPPLLFNPIVENAIWHGLLPSQNKRMGKLIISIRKEEDCLVLRIEDNGVGRSVKRHHQAIDKNRSYGIKITEQRLANINFIHKRKEARIAFEDLFDRHDSPCGTVSTIYLPLKSTTTKYEEN